MKPEVSTLAAEGYRSRKRWTTVICLLTCLVLAALAALIIGPSALWYELRDLLWQPHVTRFELEDPVRTAFHPGERARVRVEVENAEEVVITGGPAPLRFRGREFGGQGIPEMVEIALGNNPGQYVLTVEARRLRAMGAGRTLGGRRASPVRDVVLSVDAGPAPLLVGAGKLPNVPATPFRSAEAAQEWATAHAIPFRREEVPDPSQAAGTVISQEPGPGEPVERKNGLTVIVTTGGSDHEPPSSPVKQLTSGPADATFANWAADALGTAGADGTSGPVRVVLVGPSRPSGAPKVEGPVLAIGSGGAEYLQRADAAHFRLGTARRLTQTSYSRDALALLGVETPPGSGGHLQVAPREVLTTTLLRDARAWDATPLLLESGDLPPQVVVGWRGKTAFWGLAEPESLGDEMKALFQSLVRRVAGTSRQGGR